MIIFNMNNNIPESPGPSQVAIEAMQQTIRFQQPNYAATTEDLQCDPEWMALFEQGYIFVANIDPATLGKITSMERLTTDAERWYARCWYMQPHVQRQTAQAYEDGNPSHPKLSDSTLALFAKK